MNSIASGKDFALRARGQKLSRRRFLQTASVVGAASFVGCSERKPTWKQGSYRKSDQSHVAILKAASYDRDLTSVILDGIKSFRLDVVGKRVLLKPNLVEYERDTVINTHPAVIGAAIEAFLKLGAKEVKVGEGPGHRRDTDGLFLASGLYPFSRTLKPNSSTSTWTTSDECPFRAISWALILCILPTQFCSPICSSPCPS